MLRALVWKEWRAQRWAMLLATGVVAATFVTAIVTSGQLELAGPPAAVFAGMVLCCGAFRRESGTDGDTMLRRVAAGPVRVWTAAVAVALGTTAMVALVAVPAGWLGFRLGSAAPDKASVEAGWALFLESCEDSGRVALLLLPICLFLSSLIRSFVRVLGLGVLLGLGMAGIAEIGWPKQLTFLPADWPYYGIPSVSLVASCAIVARRLSPHPRRWRRRLVWMPLAVAVGTFAAGFWWINWGPTVPNIGPPFDLEAWLATDLADDQNAAYRYVLALGSVPKAESKGKPAVYQEAVWPRPWSEAAGDVEKLLREGQHALELTRQASQMPHALFHPRRLHGQRASHLKAHLLDKPGISGTTDVFGPVLARVLREHLGGLMVLKARSLYHADRPREAAGWLLAMMRMARHVEYRGTGGQIGEAKALDWMATQTLVRILDAPAWTTADLLEVGRQLQKLSQATPPLSEVYKSEYVRFQRYLDSDSSLWDGPWGDLWTWIERSKSRRILDHYFRRFFQPPPPLRGPMRSTTCCPDLV